MNNKINHPEAWKMFEEQARNIIGDPELNHRGDYRIPHPDKSPKFIYADTQGDLWNRFIQNFKKCF